MEHPVFATLLKLRALAEQWRIQTKRLGGDSQIGGRQEGLHLLKYQSVSATIVGCHTKVVTFCRSKSDYFCWSNYAIYQGKTTVESVLYY